MVLLQDDKQRTKSLLEMTPDSERHIFGRLNDIDRNSLPISPYQAMDITLRRYHNSNKLVVPKVAEDTNDFDPSAFLPSGL